MLLAASVTLKQDGVNRGRHSLIFKADNGFCLTQTPVVTSSVPGTSTAQAATPLNFKGWKILTLNETERVITLAGVELLETAHGCAELELRICPTGAMYEINEVGLTRFLCAYASRNYRPSRKLLNSFERWLLSAREDEENESWADVFPGSKTGKTMQEESVCFDRIVEVGFNSKSERHSCRYWFDNVKGLCLQGISKVSENQIPFKNYVNTGYNLHLDNSARMVTVITRNESNSKTEDRLEFYADDFSRYFYLILLLCAYQGRDCRPFPSQVLKFEDELQDFEKLMRKKKRPVPVKLSSVNSEKRERNEDDKKPVKKINSS